MKISAFFVYDEKMKSYFPTAIYEETIDVFDHIDEYDDDTFWDELSERLAYRDLIEQIGEDAAANMESGERVMKIEEIRSGYIDEFCEHGLERIYLRK